jgi:hypothetical protein
VIIGGGSGPRAAGKLERGAVLVLNIAIGFSFSSIFMRDWAWLGLRGLGLEAVDEGLQVLALGLLLFAALLFELHASRPGAFERS